ncbi:hypothetical protein SKAU_G00214040 [Synaphobranchus kaupii]|uniref:Retrotransposon gag domain-containing protein n=1 Tax=Synaphobranchus kaupii TaxID=118154 RepID=A0A9Q1IUC0_SYNKA|nr:hypothetical protein SKAU_G00214040 [Synaphobranchus kaupii]
MENCHHDNTGVVIGKQGFHLEEIQKTLKQVIDQVGQMGTLLSQLVVQTPLPRLHPGQPTPVVEAPTAVPPSPPTGLPLVPAAFPIREPCVPYLERYLGDLGKCKSFLLQCDIVFRLQPASYSTDASKIVFIMASLGGNAREWTTAVWDSQLPACDHFHTFVLEMRHVFDHPVCGRDATQRLLQLHQGNRSVVEMAVQFRILTAEARWNDSALQGAFLNALSESLKDELATREDSSSLNTLITLATSLDNCRGG